jgi:tRNA nucleotidyltransferase/poly(A) polymerase
MIWKPQSPAFKSLLDALSTETTALYVVGGAVRDFFIRRGQHTTVGKVTDIDLIVERDALAVARRAADRCGWAYYPLDPVREVARLVFTASTPALVCDISTLRGGSIEADLLTRDFTVNAIAVAWRNGPVGALIDPTGGLPDIDAQVLRRVTPGCLAEDPVRVLRAARLAVQLGFTIEEQTSVQMMRMGDTLRLVSPERIRDELWKIVTGAEPAAGIQLLQRYGLLRTALPEVADLEEVAQSAPHVFPVLRHTLEVVRHAQNMRQWLKGEPVADDHPGTTQWQAALAPLRFRLREHFVREVAGERLRADWLPWYALFHDVGKAVTRTEETSASGDVRYRFFGHEDIGARLAAERLETLRFSRFEIDLVGTVVEAHMRPHHLHDAFPDAPISRRACFRFFRDVDARHHTLLAGVDTVLLAIADYLAISGATLPWDWDAYLAHAVQLLTYAFDVGGLQQAAQPIIDGHTLMHYFSLTPGRQVGALLSSIQEAQAAGDVASPQEALALAATLLAGGEATPTR